ncbi:MAG: ROK family protein, partial [Candidatus Zixiibacteriota bacterium]
MSDNQSYAGIDIGATNIKYGLFDASGTVVYRDQKPAMVEKGSKPLLHLITNIAENLLLRAAEEELQIGWLGVGSPGVVDNLAGVIKDRCPNIPDWEGMELGSY